MTEQHATEDQLVELAVGELDQLEADSITAHLATCETCHEAYRALGDSVELVLTAAPRVPPPPGFSASALNAMGFPRATAKAVPPRRRTWVMVAAAAVLGVIAGAAGVGLMQAVNEPAELYETAGAALSTDGGEQVGTVAGSWFDGQQVYVVTVAGGDVTKAYQCQLVLADGSRVLGGSWELPAGRTATWIVARPDGDVQSMELVGPSGGVWASAQV